uniref:Uncharacterized protein n=1 Tax=viral metagenome TaxID=1070528 RepID=A0A6C0HV25_9ZZZZ
MSFPKNIHPHVGWVDEQTDSPGIKNIQHGCGIRSEVENNHAYSEGRRRSPEEYEHYLHQESITKTTPDHIKENDDMHFACGNAYSEGRLCEAWSPEEYEKPVCSSKFVDNITMEFMMNRHHYKKYLAKTDKSKYEETKKRIQTLQIFQSDIVNMVNELIQDYISCGSFSKYNSEINHTFESFMNSALRHLEENPPNDDDDDTLFNIGIGTYGSSKTSHIGTYGSSKTSLK